MSSDIDLTGLELPEVFPPAGSYVSAVVHGGVLYTAGHIPLSAAGELVCGRLGHDLTLEQGIVAAEYAALSVLATVRNELGSLDRVDRFIRVEGVVSCTADFLDHTGVINGASNMFTRVFGERGKHARLAIGVTSLPANIAVEVQATIAVRS